MGLPKITFNIATDGLNRSLADIQKIPGLVITGSTVTDQVTIGQSYQIFSIKSAEQLGITKEGANAFAWKHISEFYNTAGQGAPLWFMLVSDATTMTDILDVTNQHAKKLIEDASGNIRVIGVVKKAVGDEITVKGMDEDVTTAIEKGQQLSNYFLSKFMPVRCIISGNAFTGVVADLEDYNASELGFNSVSVLVANNDGSPEASIGLNLGKQLSIPSQRKQSRVKDGAIITDQAYFTNGEKVEKLIDAWDTIHDKGFTFFRSFPNRSGFFFSSDKTLTSNSDDFISLARGFVMDEAIIISHDVLVDQLNDEVLVTTAGLIHPAIIKSWQTNIETQLERLMVAPGKLVAVKAFIDENQNVLSTDTVKVDLQLLPVGYADFIEVNIGFTTNIDN